MVNQDVGAFLRSIGFYDKAIEYLTRAVSIAHHSVATQNQIISCLICLGKYEKAYSEIQKILIRNPENLPARVHNTTVLIMLNQLAEAEREIKTTLNIKPDKEMALSKALLWAARGEKEKALSLINDINRMNLNVPLIYIFLGMKEEAIGAIEDGIEHGFEAQGHYLYSYPMLARNNALKPLKRERRFQKILEREKAKYEEILRKFPEI